MMRTRFEGTGRQMLRSRAGRLTRCIVAISGLASFGSLVFEMPSAVAGRAPGVNPNLGEYWVTAKVTLDFPIGTTGGVGVYDDTCTNGNNGRQFKTTKTNEVLDISMLASESFPYCVVTPSVAIWRINVDGVGYRFMKMYQPTGQSFPYHLECSRKSGTFRGLKCDDYLHHLASLTATIGKCDPHYGCPDIPTNSSYPLA